MAMTATPFDFKTFDLRLLGGSIKKVMTFDLHFSSLKKRSAVFIFVFEQKNVSSIRKIRLPEHPEQRWF